MDDDEIRFRDVITPEFTLRDAKFLRDTGISPGEGPFKEDPPSLPPYILTDEDRKILGAACISTDADPTYRRLEKLNNHYWHGLAGLSLLNGLIYLHTIADQYERGGELMTVDLYTQVLGELVMRGGEMTETQRILVRDEIDKVQADMETFASMVPVSRIQGVLQSAQKDRGTDYGTIRTS